MILIEVKARYEAMSETMKANMIRTFVLDQNGYNWNEVLEKLKLPESVIHVCYSVIRIIAMSSLFRTDEFINLSTFYAKELGISQLVDDDSFANQYDYHDNP